MAYDASKPPDGGSPVAADIRENFRALKEDEIVVPSIKSAFDVLNALDKVWTYQNTAPAGWNIVAGTTDALLACKGGSQAYNAAGGTQVGTWTQPNHTHTGPSHTHTGPSHVHAGPSHAHTTPSHALSVAEMPAHSHVAYGTDNGGSPKNRVLTGVASTAHNQTTSSAGSGSAHGHGNTGAAGNGNTSSGGTGVTGAGGTGATGGGATAATYRPMANIGIIVEKT